MKASELAGVHIYQEKGRTYFFDIFTHHGYIISDKDASLYSFLSARYAGAVMVICGVYELSKKLLISFICGLAFLAVFELVFRLVYLKKLPIYDKLKRDKKDLTFEIACATPYWRIFALLVLFVVLYLEVLTIYRSVQGKLVEEIICFFINTVILFLGYFYINVLLRKKKENV